MDAMAAQQEPRKPALSGRALGLILIFLTAVIWVAASFISQLLVTSGDGRPSYNVSPFLLTYLSTSIFTVFLPLVQLKSLLQETWLLRRSFKYRRLSLQDEADEGAENERLPLAASAQQQQQQAMPPSSSLAADLDFAEAAAAAEKASAAARASAVAHRESLIAAAQCFLLWFTAQYLFNASLALTSVTSNTILSSTSSLFTFALSMVVLKEPYSLAKLLSIAACIGGTLLVTLSDSSSDGSKGSVAQSIPANVTAAAALNSTAAAGAATAAAGGPGPSHSVLGDMLCLVSACFYASYTIVLRKSLPDEDEANVALFFGYVGLLCSVVFAPVVAVLAGVGAMHLKTIPPKAYLIILVEGILNYCLSDYLWAHAVLLLGPTVATLGLSVQIPVAAVVEVLIGVPKWLSNSRSIAMMLSGTGLIMVGFVAGNLAGGGQVYGSHHKGDAEAQQPNRRSSRDFDLVAEDVLRTLNGTSADEPVVIPVSTHAAVRERSPVRGSSSSSSSPRPTRLQQQQCSGRMDTSLGGSGILQQQQQRVSVELSSIASSSNSSPASPEGGWADGGNIYQQQHQQPASTALPGSSNGSSLLQDVAQDVNLLEGQGLGSGSPLKKPYRASRLQKAS